VVYNPQFIRGKYGHPTVRIYLALQWKRALSLCHQSGWGAATATITITDYTELNSGDKVNLVAEDGTNYDFTNGDQSSINGT
jgi:hypothetical protein